MLLTLILGCLGYMLLSLTIGIKSILSLKFLGMFVGGVLIYLSGRLSSKYY